MLLFIGILFFIAAICLLGGDTKEKVMDEYCNLECKKYIHKIHQFCC